MSSTKELGLALRTLIDNNIVSNANQKDQLRIVHGFVTGVNKKEGTSPTINFSSMDGTIKIDEISVLTIPELEKGAYGDPTQNSDVTILWNVGTGDAIILAFSHLDTYTINTTKEVSIGVTDETENPDGDYNENQNSGDKTQTKYTSSSITHTVANKTDSATQTIEADKVMSEIGSSVIEQRKEEIKQSVGSSYQKVDNQGVTLEGTQISLGEGATEPTLLGLKTSLLLVDFITACSQIMVPTMMGTMPIINIPQFTALIPRCEEIKSLTVKLK
jgi:hypothetical protein